jgi:PAS domain S-box-containing protein
MADKEIKFNIEDMIVSSTNKKGEITYVNDVFCKIAGYNRAELLGQPHNIIRHPDMPKCVFRLLWSKVSQGEIIYAFVKNKAKNGDYYWVKAYVKPIIKNGEVVSITSYRKPVSDFVKEYISELYALLIDYEKTHSVDESLNLVVDYLEKRNLTYNQFIDRLSQEKSVSNEAVLNIDYKKYYNAHIVFKENIIRRTKTNNYNQAVTNSFTCEFGKWIESCEHESFTKMSSWKNLIRYHHQVHEDLESYFNASKDGISEKELDKIIKNVNNDTKLIFENLIQTIDSAKE